MQFLKTWYEELVIKYPTLGTLKPIHKERIFVSYVLEIYQGRNLKNLPRLGIKSVQNYLREAASHTTNNGQRDPRIQYTTPGLPIDGAKPFTMVKKLLSHMQKWVDGSPAHDSYPKNFIRSLLVRGSLFQSNMYIQRHMPGPSNMFSM